MGEDGAFRHAGGAAGVLQEGVVGRVQRDLGQRQVAASLERVAQRHRAADVPCGHHVAHVLDDQVDDLRLGKRQQVADRGGDDVMDLRERLHLLERMGEIVEHDDGAGAGIGQLVLQLARRVLGVDIDDGAAGPEGAEQRHRVLQQVGQHQREPVAPAQPGDLLQVGGELAGQTDQLAAS